MKVAGLSQRIVSKEIVEAVRAVSPMEQVVGEHMGTGSCGFVLNEASTCQKVAKCLPRGSLRLWRD